MAPRLTPASIFVSSKRIECKTRSFTFFGYKNFTIRFFSIVSVYARYISSIHPRTSSPGWYSDTSCFCRNSLYIFCYLVRFSHDCIRWSRRKSKSSSKPYTSRGNLSPVYHCCTLYYADISRSYRLRICRDTPSG